MSIRQNINNLCIQDGSLDMEKEVKKKKRKSKVKAKSQDDVNDNSGHVTESTSHMTESGKEQGIYSHYNCTTSIHYDAVIIPYRYL